MHIYLFLANRLLKFSLPQEISGSFRFDEKETDEALINVEARDGKWVLYSTNTSNVYLNNMITPDTELLPNSFYVLEKRGQKYLIYTKELLDQTFKVYSYKEDLNMTFGNQNEATITVNTPYAEGASIKIHITKGQLVLEKNNCLIYANQSAISNNMHYIQYGEQFQFYDISFFFLKNLLFITCPQGKISIKPQANLQAYSFPMEDAPQKLDFKDEELYQKENYFSKSPRLRRVIEEKKIKFSPPPRQSEQQELPLILTLGPMMTMGVMSVSMLVNTIMRINSGEATLASSWTSLVMSGAMLSSILVWPIITKAYNKKLKERQKKELIKKYNAYLEEKKKELEEESRLQKEILLENLLSLEDCLEALKTRTLHFWDKRIDQSDFLVTRIGTGNEFLKVSVEYPEEGFTVDEDALKKQADEVVASYKYILNVPIGYSFYDNKVTAIMGNPVKRTYFTNNILLQLLTFYSYEDLKVVVFTNEENEHYWDYLKYTNHNFNNQRDFRFFASNTEASKNVAEYLQMEMNVRIQSLGENARLFKPHYFIVIDDYDQVRRFDFLKDLTEIDANLGFSIVILEERLSKLPSKCNNFITLGTNSSGVLKNSYEKQEQITFQDEVNYQINMMQVAKILANIPIEFENGVAQLPDAVTFLEMEKVGKVEQLNILNRWNTNDSTASLRAEVGVDEQGEFMYLDLHEKYHGPHGLIAGMTGSGKSEFIITYILSMAINYSPDDVAFILIDYKGGGLAFAFENKGAGMILPHLAGTITNLDKGELDRTLVSIDSEIKRRQQVFNEARDQLGESTIDIYKYQRFYHEGRLKEAVPHLFIICDEFAELKSQQPDFMDNLISVARIGRSLGVHLILATQKPSGVVNDQIWSNSKFRVCLKVQDASDSKEMLKRPDAASLKQTGRFYLQVGYDEYFALGQSGWCGAKYFPSDSIVKQVDKSINFINDTGNFIKSIQADTGIKLEAKGEQLPAILKSIIDVSTQANKKARRLWLENIPPVILVNDLVKEYHFAPIPYQVKAILGVYDAPEKQNQGLLTYNIQEQGNTIIYGADGAEVEMLLHSIIYSSCALHSVDELNYYIFDYGSESFRTFSSFPHIGGMVFTGDDEKYKNLQKLIVKTLNDRKKKFVDYGGDYQSYNAANEEKLPLLVIVINNYDALFEMNPTIADYLNSYTRDSERYGVVFIISCNSVRTIGRRITQNFSNIYVLHLTDVTDYYNVFNVRNKTVPRDTFGRGLVHQENVNEFQTASLVPQDTNLNTFLKEMGDVLSKKYGKKAKNIPELPKNITVDVIQDDIHTLRDVPIGLSKDTLDVVTHDFMNAASTSITALRLAICNPFMESLVQILKRIPDTTVAFIDSLKLLPNVKENVDSYFDSDLSDAIKQYTDYVKALQKGTTIFIIYGVDKFKSLVNDTNLLTEFFKAIKASDYARVIFCDGTNQLKALEYDAWYSGIKNNMDGIYLGNGFANQSTFRIGKITKEMSIDYGNKYGYYISDMSAYLMKFVSTDLTEEEEL